MSRLLLSTAVLVATFFGGPASAALAAEPCPLHATFPFAIPGGLVPGTGSDPIVGAIVTSETGTFPVCTGSFVVTVPGIPVPVVIAGGEFRAIHGDGQVSAKFEGALGSIEFAGKLKFSSATGVGSVRAEFSLPDGTELRIVLEFACTLSGCVPTSPPALTIHPD
jgi:hypothetical protein